MSHKVLGGALYIASITTYCPYVCSELADQGQVRILGTGTFTFSTLMEAFGELLEQDSIEQVEKHLSGVEKTLEPSSKGNDWRRNLMVAGRQCNGLDVYPHLVFGLLSVLDLDFHGFNLGGCPCNLAPVPGVPYKPAKHTDRDRSARRNILHLPLFGERH